MGTVWATADVLLAGAPSATIRSAMLAELVKVDAAASNGNGETRYGCASGCLNRVQPRRKRGCGAFTGTILHHTEGAMTCLIAP